MSEAKPAGPRLRMIPPGDERERLVCPDCGYVAYDNPKIVVGSVVLWQDRILLCRRAIEPRAGFWTLPAGFLELGESAEDGARREAWEEARAAIELDGLLAVFSIRHVGQVQLIFRARLGDERFEAGPESAEVRLFDWVDIPWGEIAFPSVRWALEHHRATAGRALGLPGGNPPDPTAGPQGL